MNNAANNIDAKSKSLKDILFERHYKVGYFQREYKWQRNNIEDLLIDLERSFNANWQPGDVQRDVANYDKYYMGPIVLFQDGSEFSIVDGQQRLTSFMLIMIFLNKRYNSLLQVGNKFKGYIYSDYFGTSSYNMNIEERVKVLDHLYREKEVDESSLKNESSRNIFERYNDLEELFPQSLLEKNVFPLFANWLTEKLVFVEILTQTSESAYTIFETMNDRGLNLTQTELLKSFLLSNVKDELKIKELDGLWKEKISILNTIDNDQDFFKAWLRAKYAITIRTTEKGSANEDFEKIGTRFSSWTQENTKVKDGSKSKVFLDMKDSNSFYFFVKSDFDFYSELYIKLKKLEISDAIPEHRFRLLSFKGVSSSLSYPLLLSPIQKSDDEKTVIDKTEVLVNYLDCLGAFRMLLNEPITHSSIRNFIYLKVKDVRSNEFTLLKKKLQSEIAEYKLSFLKVGYTRFDPTTAKYILSRIYLSINTNNEFQNIYFQRRRDSFVIYQYLTDTDFESEKYNLPGGLREILSSSLISFTVIPRKLVPELDGLDLIKRITRLLKEKLIFPYASDNQPNLSNLKEFFIKGEKNLKEIIINLWKV